MRGEISFESLAVLLQYIAIQVLSYLGHLEMRTLQWALPVISVDPMATRQQARPIPLTIRELHARTTVESHHLIFYTFALLLTNTCHDD